MASANLVQSSQKCPSGGLKRGLPSHSHGASEAFWADAAREPLDLRAAIADTALLKADRKTGVRLKLFERTKSAMRGTISARNREPLNTP
jgi:hypothetical protein